MKYKEIIENARDIAASIKKVKDGFDRTVYEVNMKGLNSNLKVILIEARELLQQKVSTEMRHTDTDTAVQCCKDVALFSKRLLDSNIPDSLKISIFREMNIVGYMFDRNRKSYVACNDALNQFLEAIEKYKNLLSPPDLEIWNNSTFGGAEQVPFFRGYLRGIMAR